MLTVWYWWSTHFQIMNCYDGLSWTSKGLTGHVNWIRAYKFLQTAVCSGVLWCVLSSSTEHPKWKIQSDLAQCFGAKLQLVIWVSTASYSNHYAAASPAAVSVFLDFHKDVCLFSSRCMPPCLFLSRSTLHFQLWWQNGLGFFFPSC